MTRPPDNDPANSRHATAGSLGTSLTEKVN